MLSQFFYFFIILTKQGGKYILTQIMPFIDPYRHERHHLSKLLSYAVIIVMYESHNKNVKGDERGSRDVFQKNYDGLVDNSTPSC